MGRNVLVVKIDKMKKIPEINIELTSVTVSGYTIEDMMQMFGYRIQNAIFSDKKGTHGLVHKVMAKKIRWWKFWNRDIRKAYKKYMGPRQLRYAWEIDTNFDTYYNADIDWDEWAKKWKEESGRQTTVLIPEHSTIIKKKRKSGKSIMDHIRDL
jgi:hypothetical protein